MNNRAKCRLCQSVIESFHSQDLVECKCGEIAVYGGLSMQCSAKNWSNLIRVDDEGNEIVPIVKEGATLNNFVSRMGMFKEMIDSFDKLPEEARMTPVTQTDLQNALKIIYSLLAD